MLNVLVIYCLYNNLLIDLSRQLLSRRKLFEEVEIRCSLLGGGGDVVAAGVFHYLRAFKVVGQLLTHFCLIKDY